MGVSLEYVILVLSVVVGISAFVWALVAIPYVARYFGRLRASIAQETAPFDTWRSGSKTMIP